MIQLLNKKSISSLGKNLGIVLLTGLFPLTALAAPTIIDISPNHGPTSGGTAVTIIGSDFVAGTGLFYLPINVTNSSGSPLSNYQLRLSLDTSSLITAGKMRSDCGDMRFTDTGKTADFNYFLENDCNTISTIVWVKVSSIPTGDSVIYLSYGNPTQTSASDGTQTFIFFDNFEGGNAGDSVNTIKWPTLNNYLVSGAAWIKTDTANNEGSLVGGNDTMGVDNAFREMTSQTFAIPNETAAAVADFNWTVSSEGNYDFLSYCITSSAGTPAEPSCDRTSGADHVYGISGSPSWAREISSDRGVTFPANYNGKIKFHFEKDSSVSVGQDRGWIDALKIRKYVFPEPTVTGYGSEEPTFSSVSFGGTAATATILNSGQIDAIAPEATSTGAINVIITNPDSTSYTSIGGYTYDVSLPSAPTALIATSQAGQVGLTWTVPSSTGGSAITDYAIQYRTSPSGNWNPFSDGTSTATSTTVTGLNNGTAYDFEVAAVNAIGTGPYSPLASATPNLVYSIPTVNYAAYNMGISRVQLAGDTVNIDNSSSTPPVTPAYNLYTGLPAADLSIGHAPYTLSVTSGPNYSENLGAWIDWNSDGDFLDTNELIDIVNNVDVNNTATFTFSVPSDAASGTHRLRVGSEYSYYDLNTSGNGSNQYGEYEDYNITITAVPISEARNLIIQNYSTPGEVTLAWDPPLNNGGSAIDSYIIRYGSLAGSCDPTNYSDLSCSSSTASGNNPPGGTITGLNTSLQYKFAVFAVNANSEHSATSSNEISAPPVSITGITPDITTNEAPATFTINGKFFYSGPTPAATTARLTLNTTNITCSVNSISDTQLNCDFNLTSVPPGQYSVVVENADGSSATLTNGLTINAGSVAIDSVTPNFGTIAGGTPVTITGHNFVPQYYQVPYTIGPISQTTTDLQVAITVDTANLINLGKMNADCSDIRFYDTNQTTPLNFWFQGPCNSAVSIVWVKVPTVSNSQNTIIYMTHGQPNLTSASSANNTFLDILNVGLQASYPMEDSVSSTTITDQSGNGLNASYPTTSSSTFGKHGHAKYFDFSHYANAGNPAALPTTGPLTLETWAYMSSQTYGNYPRLISKFSCAPYNGYELLIGGSGSLTNRPFLQLGNGGSLTYVSANTLIYPDAQWHHIVATYDPAAASYEEAKIYVDGNLSIYENTVGSGTAIASSSTPLTLGNWSCDNSNNFTGYLDDTRIYNQVLTAGQISEIYQNISFSDPGIPNALIIRKDPIYDPTVTAGTETGKGIQITFGGIAATAITFQDNNTLTATTPAHADGQVAVHILNGNADTFTLSNGFNYLDRRLKVEISTAHPVTINEPFDMIVTSVDPLGNPYNVGTDTHYIVSVQTGTGQISNVTGIITQGNSSSNLTGSSYDKVENGVVLNVQDDYANYPDPNHFILTSANSSAFNVLPSPAAANPNSTVNAEKTTILGDGIDYSTITVHLLSIDSAPAHDKETNLTILNNPPNAPVITAIPCTILGPVGISNQNGDACFKTTSIYSGTFTFQATSVTDNVIITDTKALTFTGPTAADSTLTANKTSALANNSSKITLTATVRDQANSLFANHTVSLQRTDTDSGHTTITAVNCPTASLIPGQTNVNGQACFEITANVPGTYTIEATNTIDNQTFPSTPLQLIFGSGTVWGNSAPPIANAINDSTIYHGIEYQQIIPSSDGDYIATWIDSRRIDAPTSGVQTTLMAQKFDSNGAPLWNSGINYDRDGMVIFDATTNVIARTTGNDIHEPHMVADNAGGVIVTWYMKANGIGTDATILGQHLSNNGSPTWDAPYKILVQDMHENLDAQAPQFDMISDGNGGIFLTYRHFDGTSNWNGNYYAHDRYIDRYNIDGSHPDSAHDPDSDGFELDWPYNISVHPDCQNLWGKLLLVNTLNIHQGLVRIIYDQRTTGACNSTSETVPLKVQTVNGNATEMTETLLATSAAGDQAYTGMMDSYSTSSPYPLSGSGYTTGCASVNGPYEQGQPQLVDDGNGGIFITFSEVCDNSVHVNNWDAQIVIEHIPSTSTGLLPGARIIGQCLNNSCAIGQPNPQDIYADGNKDGKVFVAWHDKYDNGDLQQYTTTAINGYSVPTPSWDSAPLTAYKNPLHLSFDQIAADHSGGIFAVNNYPVGAGHTNNFQNRATAYHIYADGSPILNQTVTNGWSPNGNQISSIPSSAIPPDNKFMNSDEQFISTTINGSSHNSNLATVDANGDLLTAFLHDSIPIYANHSLDGYIQKMIGSSGLPAFQTANVTSEIQLDHSLDTQTIVEQPQDEAVGAKVAAGEFVFAWRDGLDPNGTNSPSPTAIRIEKFNEDGTPEWNTFNPPGRSFGIKLAVSNPDLAYTTPLIVADKSSGSLTGNSIIAFQNTDTGGQCIYIQKIGPNGQPLSADGGAFWNSGTFTAEQAACSSTLQLLGLTSNNQGGAVVTYLSSNGSITVVDINGSDGSVSFSHEITAVSGETFQNSVSPILLGNGNVAIIYYSASTINGETLIKGDVLSPSSGGSSTISGPKTISLNTHALPDSSLFQQNPDAILDSSGSNLFLAFESINTSTVSSSGQYCISVEKLNSSLDNVWTGALPCQNKFPIITGNLSTPFYQTPKLSLDSNGDLDIVMVLQPPSLSSLSPNTNAGTIWDIKLNGDTGNQIWNLHQVSNLDNNLWNHLPQISSDGLAGHFISSRAFNLTSGNTNILLQHVVSGINQIHNILISSINYGIPLASNLSGLSIADNPNPQIINDNAYSALVSWLQITNSASDIYAQYFVDNRQAYSSSISASTNPVPADGATAITVTATLLDSNGQPSAGQTLDLYDRVYQNFISTTSNPPTITSALCASGGTAGQTNNLGKQCWAVTETSPAVLRVTAYDDALAPRSVFTSYAELVYSILPPDAARSTFTASPAEVNNNGTEYSHLTATVKDALNNPLSGKNVALTDDTLNTSVNYNNVPCFNGGPIGLTDNNGQECWQVTSLNHQTVNFTATVGGTTAITQLATVTFRPPPADPNLSYIISSGTYIESVDPAIYDTTDLTLASPVHAHPIKVYVSDSAHNALVGKPVVLSFTPSDASMIVKPVDCTDPRNSQLITPGLPADTNLTDTYGTACFLIFNNTSLTQNEVFNQLAYTIHATVDQGEASETSLISTANINIEPRADANIFHYKFRNDDGNELVATPIAPLDTPAYNATASNPFRLRLGITRKVPSATSRAIDDEFTPISNTNIGNQTLSTLNTNGRAYSATTIDETNHTLYTATVSANDSDKVTIYGYDTFNMSQTPSSFTFPTTVDYSLPYGTNPNAPINGNNYDIPNMFVDSANNLLYLVASPNRDSSSVNNLVRIYKINLGTHQVVNVLSENLAASPYFSQFSHDSEIDLDHGFLYVTFGGYSQSGLARDNQTRVMKIKLNAPAATMTKVGQLVLGNLGDNITSSLIDTTNQFMYVTTGTADSGMMPALASPLPTQIIKIDLNVDATLPPVKVSDINLVPNPETSLYETVGFQSSVIDPTDGYAYFAASTDYKQQGSTTYPATGNQAYITKVDINPNRQFEVVSRTKLSATGPTPSEDSDQFSEYVYFPTLSTERNFTPTASIDTTNHFAYFPGAHFNITRSDPVWKLNRYDLESGTIDWQTIDQMELNYPSGSSRGIFGNIFSPSTKRGFFIRPGQTADNITTFNTTTKWVFRLQSARNTSGTNPSNYSGEFCDQTNSDLQWSNLPNTDFTASNTGNYSDGAPSTDVTGLLPNNNETFVPGELKSASATSSAIKLSRKEYTELEYSLVPTSEAKGTYCFRLIDADPAHDNQISGYPNIMLGAFDGSTPLTATGSNYNIPITVNGVIISKSNIFVVEGTTTDSYEIKLATQPTAAVTIHIEASDARLTLNPLSNPANPHATDLTFDSTDWDTYQKITLSSANDNGLDTNGLPTGIEGMTNGLIHHTSTSTDPAYDKLAIQPVQSAVTDYGAATSTVIATIGGQATFSSLTDSFSFPAVGTGANSPNFSPDITLSVDESRGTHSDYYLTVQAAPFCKSPGVCIPLDRIYLAVSDLTNTFNTFTPTEIGEFIPNYLGPNDAHDSRSSYAHSESEPSPADRTLATPITLIDTRNIPSGSTDNPLQGPLTFKLHLMIDYAHIPPLEIGTYTTSLVFDLDTNPMGQ